MNGLSMYRPTFGALVTTVLFYEIKQIATAFFSIFNISNLCLYGLLNVFKIYSWTRLIIVLEALGKIDFFFHYTPFVGANGAVHRPRSTSGPL